MSKPSVLLKSSTLVTGIKSSTLVVEIKSSILTAKIKSSSFRATVRFVDPVLPVITSRSFRCKTIHCKTMKSLIVLVDVLPRLVLNRLLGVGVCVQIVGDPIDEGKSGVITHASNPWTWLGDPQPVYAVRFPDGSGRVFVRSNLVRSS